MAVAIPVAILAAKLFQGWLSNKSAQKQADAKAAADAAKLKAETDNWNVGQDRRVGQLNAVQGLEQRVKPFLRSGPGGAAGSGPDYTFDPAVLKTMQAKAPYPGSLPPDPHAGIGSAFGASAAGAVGDALLSYYGAQNGGGGISGSTLNKDPVNDPGSPYYNNPTPNWGSPADNPYDEFLKSLKPGQGGGSQGGA